MGNKAYSHGGEGGADKLLIRAGWVATPDPGSAPGAVSISVAEDQAIAVDGGDIVYVGEAAGAPAEFDGAPTLDARGRAVIPGFVNAHNHAAMTLLRGYADDWPLMDWLKEKIWPAEARLTGEDVYWGTMLAIAEQFRSGITSFADMYFFMDHVAQAAADSGTRAYLSRGMVGDSPDAPDGGSRKSLGEAVDLFQRWHHGAGGRITVGLAPHAPYTVPDGLAKDIIAEARRLGASVHIHLAETRNELEIVRAEKGCTPVQWASDMGFFDVPVLAAHCVHVDEGDLQLMAGAADGGGAVGIAHNPISNVKLASGIAPVPEMLSGGLAVGLGTDGACSTNHLNMFEQMRLAAWLQKVDRHDARALKAETAFWMATAGGAAACGLENVGCVAPGYKADLTIISLDAPHMVPYHDLISLLVYSAQTGDVETVMVEGRTVYDGGRFLSMDMDMVKEQCRRRAGRLVEGL